MVAYLEIAQLQPTALGVEEHVVLFDDLAVGAGQLAGDFHFALERFRAGDLRFDFDVTGRNGTTRGHGCGVGIGLSLPMVLPVKRDAAMRLANGLRYESARERPSCFAM